MSFKEVFAQFLEDPTREGLRDILKLNYGETDNLDFKSEWPSYSKIAKLILALANSGGGCIVFGVTESNDGVLETVGLTSLIDKADIDKGVHPYLPEQLVYAVHDFSYTESEYGPIVGKRFQVLIVRYEVSHTPFVSKKGGDGIAADTVYVRRGTSSVAASHDELQRILNNRIETGYSTSSELRLEEHLAQLKIFFSNLDRYHYTGGVARTLARVFSDRPGIFYDERSPNPSFPEEDLERFIVRMIDSKKKKIESVLDLK